MGNAKVCIILVNYNGYKDTVECVQSILKCQYSNYEIIIVDNDSKDADNFKSDTWLNSTAHIVYSNYNSGFSIGNNIGIEYAQKFKPDYILLLNNDTIVLPGFIQKLLSPFYNNPKVAMTTGTINYYYDKENSWYKMGSFSNFTGYTRMIRKDNESNSLQCVSFSTGCLMMISYQYIKQYGMLSSKFFLYSEDTEYCQRMISNGYKIMSVPDVLIYHKVNASTGSGSKMQQYYLIRNYLYVAKKYTSCFFVAYIFRYLVAMYEIVKYHYDLKTINLAYHDFRCGVEGKVDYFN